jgi:hypothetical protein
MPTDLAELDTHKWTPIHEDAELMAAVQGKLKLNAAGGGTPKAS